MIQRISRRKFLVASGITAVATVASKSVASQAPLGYLAQAAGPETNTIRLGYIPILESAPLIIAEAKGFFKKHGMTDVKLLKQASWGAARDNMELGSAGGGIDGGQWQMPMPYLFSEGLITKGNTKIPTYVLLQTSTQGNGIAVANKHLGKKIGLNMAGARSYIEGLKKANTPFTAAFTFPKVNQDFWIRYWLAAGGIDPDDDVKLIVVPPAQTVANMRTGTMDGFSTGDPWPYRIATDNIGFLAALTAQMWKFHPEEYLGIRAAWVDKNPRATRALLSAVMEAQQWCDNLKNRQEFAEILSRREYINVPADVLGPPLSGRYIMGDGRPEIRDRMMGPLFWKDGRGSVSYPYKSHDLWFLTESVRWGFLKPGANTMAAVNKINREDIWKDAARQLGVPAADIPTSTSRGVETFFDGVKFDPSNPTAYLRSLKIKKVKV
ncbi:MAG: ABC transporter substrate-binding protein [Gloeomargaritaceae cyanobacterium C42_A2020_066]|nr:ABC transporter substrate-binding protein [Gloeomargaritaceae cyanobacterium C42_A2020_066]